ncbi:MAG: rhomboid family intramembrane serine protease [Luteolibacter sp.]
MADRDYYRKEYHGTGPMAQITPVVKWLLILNLGIYFLDTLVLKGPGLLNGPIRNAGAFTIQSAIFHGEIWRFITFQFIHASVPHVLFNSLGIFFFGPWMERWWGSKKFLIFYLLCGVAGAVFYSLLVYLGVLHVSDPDFLESAAAYLPGVNPMTLVPLVGASAGIYGILIGVAVIAPSLRVRLLFPPIELSMRQLAMALMAMAIGSIVFKLGGNEGGEAGHLGGAILGFLLVRFPHLLGQASDIAIFRPKAFSRPPEPKLRPRSAMEKEQDSELDRILDKISSHGFHSLTDEEKAILHELSNSKNSRQ